MAAKHSFAIVSSMKSVTTAFSKLFGSSNVRHEGVLRPKLVDQMRGQRFCEAAQNLPRPFSTPSRTLNEVLIHFDHHAPG